MGGDQQSYNMSLHNYLALIIVISFLIPSRPPYITVCYYQSYLEQSLAILNGPGSGPCGGETTGTFG